MIWLIIDCFYKHLLTTPRVADEARPRIVYGPRCSMTARGVIIVHYFLLSASVRCREGGMSPVSFWAHQRVKRITRIYLYPDTNCSLVITIFIRYFAMPAVHVCAGRCAVWAYPTNSNRPFENLHQRMFKPIEKKKKKNRCRKLRCFGPLPPSIFL